MPPDPQIDAVIDRHFRGPPMKVVLNRHTPAVRQETLGPLIQAYMRGLGRIVAAESDHLRRILRQEPPDSRAQLLDSLLSSNLSRAHELFRGLHRVMLKDALEDTLSADVLEEPDMPERVIALVDICGSTQYLEAADRHQTRQMVDALYEASQIVITNRPVWAVKYVGDGVFFVGRHVQDVADASRHAITVLERELPLRARSGLAAGPVVRRAGDYFGTVVNLAQRLTSVAQPGTVLAAEPAVSALEHARVRDRRLIELRGISEPVAVAVIA